MLDFLLAVWVALGTLYVMYFFNYKFRIRLYLLLLEYKPFARDTVAYNGEMLYYKGIMACFIKDRSTMWFTSVTYSDLGEIAYILREEVKAMYRQSV